MGIFNRLVYGNPNKPDLEVEENPNPIKSFFEVMKIKIWDLVKLNLLFMLFVIPTVVWAGINVSVINNTLSAYDTEALLSTAFMESGAYQYLTLFFLGLIPCLMIMGVALPSLTYITRSYAREFHVWMMEDFGEKIKENWKQSLLYMFVLGVVILLMYYGILIYSVNLDTIPMARVLRAIMYSMLVLVLVSTTFAYPLMVTFEIKFKTLIKNSILLTIAKLPQTILILLITALMPIFLTWLTFVWQYGFLVLIAYFLIFGFSFNSFLINAFTNQVFDKLIKANSMGDATQKPEIKHDEK